MNLFKVPKKIVAVVDTLRPENGYVRLDPTIFCSKPEKEETPNEKNKREKEEMMKRIFDQDEKINKLHEEIQQLHKKNWKTEDKLNAYLEICERQEEFIKKLVEKTQKYRDKKKRNDKKQEKKKLEKEPEEKERKKHWQKREKAEERKRVQETSTTDDERERN